MFFGAGDKKVKIGAGTRRHPDRSAFLRERIHHVAHRQRRKMFSNRNKLKVGPDDVYRWRLSSHLRRQIDDLCGRLSCEQDGSVFRVSIHQNGFGFLVS